MVAPLTGRLHERLSSPDPAVTCDFEGFRMIQNPDELPMIRAVLDDFRPHVAVEFGTYAGGFAAFLASTLWAWGGQVLTVDIEQDPNVRDRLHDAYKNVRVVECDLFAESAETQALVATLGQARTLLYCDDGKKLEELRRYAPLVGRPGLVGVHDYGVELFAEDAEPRMASLGYAPHRHAEFAGEYPRGLTRFWIRS